MARYSYTGDAADRARRAEAGMLPIFEATPGFRSSSLADSDGEVLSLSVWDSAESAEAAHALAADWISENRPESWSSSSVARESFFSRRLGVTA